MSTIKPLLHQRTAPIEMNPDEFRKLGHQLVDQIAEFLASISERPVKPHVTHEDTQAVLGQRSLPEQGDDPEKILGDASRLLFDYSTLIGHPRFWGYICGAPAPIGALADFLAAAVNPNLGGWTISPIATEIETQTVQWLAELIGYPSSCGGLLTSGGNAANFLAFLAARRAKVPWNVRENGIKGGEQNLYVYVSKDTHTWIQKAADLFGIGTNAIRWVETDSDYRMDMNDLRRQIEQDKKQGHLPFMVVGAAGTTAVGAVDPLFEIAAICREHDLWFHVDGAYGAPAVILPDADPNLKGMSEADSIAVDPHKWLYSAVEAGCTLVRDPKTLLNAFSYRPDYYPLDHSGEINYYEYGLQNSRGFKALKVWMALQQVGREGYVEMLGEDVRLARAFYDLAAQHPELEAVSHSLSITNFRYIPAALQAGTPDVDAYLNDLNRELLTLIQQSGEAYVTNAILDGRYTLRLCIVNFRTSLADMEALAEIVTRLGKSLDADMRPDALR